ncbi:unnamed protein product [Toxocara canis]|uniref:Ovule protein n=1 Tax=Toxocara canis TaxID=6265 RepID=A0A183V1V8_TOXCA|nr:unnamed protein product [Toxocara canis]
MPSVVMIGIRLNLFKMNDVGTAITYSGPGLVSITFHCIFFSVRFIIYILYVNENAYIPCEILLC